MVDSGGYHTSLLTTRQQLPLIGRDRRMNPRYAAFQSHYAFEPSFGMPVSGNEKPGVENRVKTIQRRWGYPGAESEEHGRAERISSSVLR